MAEKPTSLAPILRMEDVFEMDTMLTPEGPTGRRRTKDSDGDRGKRKSLDIAIHRSAEDIRGRRRKTDDSEEELPSSSAAADAGSQGSGSKRVQIVVDRYYRRRSVDGKMCKCYNRDLSAGSNGSRSYGRHKSPDHLDVHPRYRQLIIPRKMACIFLSEQNILLHC